MNSGCKNPTCQEKALSLSDHCWNHIQDKRSYIVSLEEHNQAGNSMENFHLKGLDAPSINLLHANLKNANISNAFLRGASLSGANLSGVYAIGSNLSEVDFIGCDCIGANFMMADLSKARFWHANMKGVDLSESKLNGADFLNAGLYNCNLHHANLRDARFLTKDNFKGEGSKEGVNESGSKSARESYANIKQHFVTNARYNDVSWASYNENRMELRRLWEEKRPGYIPFLIMGLLCGWGERPLRATVSAVSIILLYASAYFMLQSIESARSVDYSISFLDYIYYSVITFTTVGYGDFLPKAGALYKLLAGSEAFIGIFMMGLFVFSLGRRYASR